jgi:hypothetical protein
MKSIPSTIPNLQRCLGVFSPSLTGNSEKNLSIYGKGSN